MPFRVPFPKKQFGDVMDKKADTLDIKATLTKHTEPKEEPTTAKVGDRIHGATEQLAGTVKNKIGHLIGDEKMEAEGKVAELKGKANHEYVKSGEWVKGSVQVLGGTVQNRIGHLIDDEEMEAKGKLLELKGQARQQADQ
jgi:uncharacterized protein YjbJ (UPF0337 family)